MRTTQQLSITLPHDLADAVKTKVQQVRYTTESEVIREGLRTRFRVTPNHWTLYNSEKGA